MVHIVDTVIPPPLSVSKTAEAAKLTSLLNALVETKLGDTLNSLKDVTIFAPTNEAFTALASKGSGNLTISVADALKLHVVPGVVAFSTSLSDGQKIKTLSGKELTVKIANGVVTINGAKVVTADVIVNSGVVHIIDRFVSRAGFKASG